MVSRQFGYTWRFYIENRQDTWDKGRVYSEIKIRKNNETGPNFVIKRMCNIDGMERHGTKYAFHEL